MQERLSLEHSSELIADTLEQLLNGGGVTQEGNRHLKAAGRDITLSSEHVIGDPFNKVSRVLVLHILHLFLDVLHSDFATEYSSNLQMCEHHGRDMAQSMLTVR